VTLARAALLARIATAIALAVPTFHSARHVVAVAGRVIAPAELLGAALLVWSRVWRTGAGLLLAVFCVAFVHHALMGHMMF
jgi:hypothetical protein